MSVATKTTSAKPALMSIASSKMGIQAVLAIKDLQVDPIYQRDAVDGHYDKIGATWDWHKYSPINVAHRPDGSYYVYDGGNRVVAARMVGLSHLPCYVVESDGAKEEATAFVGMNEGRRRLKPLDKFKAMAAAGDPIQAFLAETFRMHGIVSTSATSCGVGKTTAVNTFVNWFKKRKFDSARLDVLCCMNVIAAAWGDQQRAYSGRAVEGVLRLVSRVGDRDLLVSEAADRLGRYEIDDLLNKAEALSRIDGKTIVAHLPNVMLDAFNYRRTKNRLA